MAQRPFTLFATDDEPTLDDLGEDQDGDRVLSERCRCLRLAQQAREGKVDPGIDLRRRVGACRTGNGGPREKPNQGEAIRTTPRFRRHLRCSLRTRHAPTARSMPRRPHVTLATRLPIGMHRPAGRPAREAAPDRRFDVPAPSAGVVPTASGGGPRPARSLERGPAVVRCGREARDALSDGAARAEPRADRAAAARSLIGQPLPDRSLSGRVGARWSGATVVTTTVARPSWARMRPAVRR